jgi:hypothetical protein
MPNQRKRLCCLAVVLASSVMPLACGGAAAQGATVLPLLAIQPQMLKVLLTRREHSVPVPPMAPQLHGSTR